MSSMLRACATSTYVSDSATIFKGHLDEATRTESVAAIWPAATVS